MYYQQGSPYPRHQKKERGCLATWYAKLHSGVIAVSKSSLTQKWFLHVAFRFSVAFGFVKSPVNVAWNAAAAES